MADSVSLNGMQCKHPIEKRPGQFVPCGCCVACRINETTDWSIRALYELHDFDNASFVTLTYNEENYPKDCSVHKEVLADWWDSFQHTVKREKGFSPRIFSCGEYGSRTGRAHYHAILYGLNPDPFDKNNIDRRLIANSWKYCNKEMFDWNRFEFNKNAINFCNRETIQYVAGYIQKKLKSYQAKEAYEKNGLQAPFKLASKKLGLNFALEQKDIIRENNFCVYNGFRVRVPRYFREKLNMTLPCASSGKEPNQEQLDFQERKIAEFDDNVNVLVTRSYVNELSRKEGWRKLDLQFKAWLSDKGLPVNAIDNIENAALRERLFSWWYETKLADVAAYAEKEFQMKCRFNAKEL